MAYSRYQQYNPYNDWSVDSRGREVNALGQHKTVGYSPKRTPARSFGGLNEHYIRQNYDGSREAIDEAAQEARKSGVLISKDGQRMADTWKNRGYSSRADQNPYAQPQGPTPDQQRWADKAAANKLEAGDGQMPNPDGLDEYGEEPAPATTSTSILQPSKVVGGVVQPAVVGTTRASQNPYFSRAGNIENAKAAGEFDSVRDKYNADSEGSGYRMDENGTITTLSKTDDGTGTSPFARERFGPRAEEMRAERDFAKGEAPVRFTDPNVGPNADEMNMRPIRAEKINPYGTATATLTPDGSAAKPGGTMTDPLTGKTVPMRQWAADQSAVQATKYGPGRDASGNLIDGPSAAQAGKNFFNPSKVPLGQDDADQYRQIARGGDITKKKDNIAKGVPGGGNRAEKSNPYVTPDKMEQSQKAVPINRPIFSKSESDSEIKQRLENTKGTNSWHLKQSKKLFEDIRATEELIRQYVEREAGLNERKLTPEGLKSLKDGNAKLIAEERSKLADLQKKYRQSQEANKTPIAEPKA